MAKVYEESAANGANLPLHRKGTKDIVTDKSPRKSFLFFPNFGTRERGNPFGGDGT